MVLLASQLASSIQSLIHRLSVVYNKLIMVQGAAIEALLCVR